MAHYQFRNIPHGTRKNGEKLHTRVHADYINREGDYSNMYGREEDLVYKTSGNLPVWAKGDPREFWQAVEENKGAKARGYREFLLGLQEELTLEENIGLVEKFIDETGIRENHAFSYAIHDKLAAFDSTHHNIHCHLMFNEKIIEKDRPLEASKYFKQYSINADGEPSSGYKTSRQFSTKAANLELRKKWAVIVNDKFAEKGLDVRIDERTLVAQRDDLLAQGKTIEAAYFDRKPAPHLGAMYRNEATMEMLLEKIDEVDKEKRETGNLTAEEAPEYLSEKDRKIFDFVQDFVLRKLAKEIQEERLKRQERKAKLDEEYRRAREAEEREQEIKEQPYVVTAGDIAERLLDKIEEKQQFVDSYKAKYYELKKHFISENAIERFAIDRMFNGEYRAALNGYKMAIKGYENCMDDIKKLENNGKSWDDNFDTYAEVAKRANAHDSDKEKYGKAIAYFKGKLNEPEMQKQLAEVQKAVLEEKAENDTAAKYYYGMYKKGEKQLNSYLSALEKVKALQPNDVIWAEKIPSQLHRNCRLDGVDLVKEQMSLVYDAKTYYVIANDGLTAQAVKLGDDITKGKVPVYKLTLSKPEKEGGKPKVTGVTTTDKKQAVYAKKDSNAKGTTSAKSDGRSAKNVKPIPEHAQKSIVDKAEQIVDKLMENQTLRLDAYWPKDDDMDVVYDEAKMVEKQMYQGWSL